MATRTHLTADELLRLPDDGKFHELVRGELRTMTPAVEILSPSDTVMEVEEKVEDYLSAGTRAAWVVNPKLRRVTIHEPGAAPRVLSDVETLEGEEVLPGFACGVADIFAWPV